MLYGTGQDPWSLRVICLVRDKGSSTVTPPSFSCSAVCLSTNVYHSVRHFLRCPTTPTLSVSDVPTKCPLDPLERFLDWTLFFGTPWYRPRRGTSRSIFYNLLRVRTLCRGLDTSLVPSSVTLSSLHHIAPGETGDGGHPEYSRSSRVLPSSISKSLHSLCDLHNIVVDVN